MNAPSLLLTLCLSAVGLAQARPLAIQNAQIITVSGETVHGTVLVQHGKVQRIGKDIEVPAGATVLDARGGSVMPGFVHAFSRAGLDRVEAPRMENPGPRGRRGPQIPTPQPAAPSAGNRSASAVAQGLYARQTVFRELLKAGVTSLAIAPRGNGLPGHGSLINPAGKTLSELTLTEKAFLLLVPSRDSSTKKLLREAFTQARKTSEERRRPAPASQPSEAAPPTAAASQPTPAAQPAQPATPASQPSSQPSSQPNSRPQPAKDPNNEALTDCIDGKVRVVIEVDSAADLLHGLDAISDPKPKYTIAWSRLSVGSGRVDEVLDSWKAAKAIVLMPPTLTTEPNTQYRVNPAQILDRAGIEVGFILGDTHEEIEQLLFRLMELVRSGLPAPVAYKAVTLVPAKALGIEARVGSIEPGKDADLLLFDGDPLDPKTKLRKVWQRGEEISKDDPIKVAK